MSRHSIPDASTIDAAWRKSSKSGGHENCVELAPYQDGIAIRDSKSPDGPAILHSRSQIASLLAGIRTGAFDKE
ncbi:DUF397 domain-containing protein [Streptomyces acidiscabies]|uniref:DUF397 domain-containing protein n=1 Tax=Streptomyces acidiscabies TaxID=42234 RepID=UPI000951CC15|nr:DUF397 domain-containing protein [Streptomyces acidiscabies]